MYEQFTEYILHMLNKITLTDYLDVEMIQYKKVMIQKYYNVMNVFEVETIYSFNSHIPDTVTI